MAAPKKKKTTAKKATKKTAAKKRTVKKRAAKRQQVAAAPAPAPVFDPREIRLAERELDNIRTASMETTGDMPNFNEGNFWPEEGGVGTRAPGDINTARITKQDYLNLLNRVRRLELQNEAIKRRFAHHGSALQEIANLLNANGQGRRNPLTANFGL